MSKENSEIRLRRVTRYTYIEERRDNGNSPICRQCLIDRSMCMFCVSGVHYSQVAIKNTVEIEGCSIREMRRMVEEKKYTKLYYRMGIDVIYERINDILVPMFVALYTKILAERIGMRRQHRRG